MLQDVEAGRSLELDGIVDAVREIAARRGRIAARNPAEVEEPEPWCAALRSASGAAQRELETLARRQSVLEDEQLDVMERREALDADYAHQSAFGDRHTSRRGHTNPAGTRSTRRCDRRRRRQPRAVLPDQPANHRAGRDRAARVGGAAPGSARVRMEL